jgi:hypothetical protein
MEVNRAKSGILAINGVNLSPGTEAHGYPVVETYKYLGLLMNGKLDLKDHLKLINRKANFTAYRLYGLRKLDDVKLNMSMFKLCIMPVYRLAHTLYARQDAAAKEKV